MRQEHGLVMCVCTYTYVCTYPLSYPDHTTMDLYSGDLHITHVTYSTCVLIGQTLLNTLACCSALWSHELTACIMVRCDEPIVVTVSRPVWAVLPISSLSSHTRARATMASMFPPLSPSSPSSSSSLSLSQVAC